LKHQPNSKCLEALLRRPTTWNTYHPSTMLINTSKAFGAFRLVIHHPVYPTMANVFWSHSNHYHHAAARNKSSDQTTFSEFREPLDTTSWKPQVSQRWTPMTIVLICEPLLTFGLGTWEVQRLGWKCNHIKDLEHKMSIEPITLPTQINPTIVPEFEYRKVKLIGRFDHSQGILIQSRTRDSELEYHVITLFYRDDGGDSILVNRGFIKREIQASCFTSIKHGTKIG
ncbi:hypothetical protein O181_121689, partial [Austropuccinia psidii MF-1]|nr:hypothetical protein [Austropuccinia psidii MF-1]